MDKEPITINGLEKIKDELIFLKEKKFYMYISEMFLEQYQNLMRNL